MCYLGSPEFCWPPVFCFASIFFPSQGHIVIVSGDTYWCWAKKHSHGGKWTCALGHQHLWMISVPFRLPWIVMPHNLVFCPSEPLQEQNVTFYLVSNTPVFALLCRGLLVALNCKPGLGSWGSIIFLTLSLVPWWFLFPASTAKQHPSAKALHSASGVLQLPAVSFPFLVGCSPCISAQMSLH